MALHSSKYMDVGIVVLRIGLSLVLLWFGTNQLSDISAWTGYVPRFLLAVARPEVFVITNSIFEIIFATLLLAGLFTSPAALLLSLHLLVIAATIGYNEVGVRDFGLSISLLALVFLGGGRYSVDCWFRSAL